MKDNSTDSSYERGSSRPRCPNCDAPWPAFGEMWDPDDYWCASCGAEYQRGCA